jgi:hypothetical protein
VTEPAPPWAPEAEALKRDGYTAAVVARKLIELHGVPRAEAEAWVGQLFGKQVNAFAGERAQDQVMGGLLLAAGIGGAVVFFLAIGARVSARIGFVYLALALTACKGLHTLYTARRTPPQR